MITQEAQEIMMQMLLDSGEWPRYKESSERVSVASPVCYIPNDLFEFYLMNPFSLFAHDVEYVFHLIHEEQMHPIARYFVLTYLILFTPIMDIKKRVRRFLLC